MLEELKNFLASTAPGETEHLINDTIDLLDLYNYNDYNDYIMQVLMTIDDKDNLQVLDEIVENFTIMVKAVLSEHSIFLIDEVSLKSACSILSGLHLLENTDQIDYVHNILNGNYSDEEMLSELIANHSNISVEDCLLYIDNITPSVIKAIKELFKDKVEFKPSALIDDQKEKTLKINRLKKLIDGKDCFISQVIRSGIKLDMDFQSYVNIYKGSIDEMTYDEVAHALLGFSIMSKDRDKESLEFLNDYISANYSSLTDFSKINSELKLLYSKANAF